MNQQKFTITLEGRATDMRGKSPHSTREQAKNEVKEFNVMLRKMVYGEPFTVIFQRLTDKKEMFALTGAVSRSELGNDEQEIPTLKIQLESK
jgi:hypothetical protein